MSTNITVEFDGFLLTPAPMVTVTKEFTYVNDAIIGFTYVINLKGYAVSNSYNNTDNNVINTINAIDNIHAILHKNGKNLILRCSASGEILMKATGSQFKSFNVSETDNKWVQYAEYSASIEFNKINYTDQITSEIAADSVGGDLYPYLLKLKSYKDSWDFKSSDEEAYSYYLVEGIASEDYTRFNIEYTITATGKHYYDDNGNLKPAWEVAKEFVQKKIYSQIATFRSASPMSYHFFPITNYNSNETNGVPYLNNALTGEPTGMVFYPLLSSSVIAQFAIFNEKIQCSVSESDGTFTATYSCVCKKRTNWMPYSIHTFTVSYDKVRDFKEINNTISVNGTVQGLLPTNILAAGAVDGATFILPYNGSFLASTLDAGTKYYNAANDMFTYLINPSKTDLHDNFKIALNINYISLFTVNTLICVDPRNLVDPRSFSVVYNYENGSLDYSVEYDTNRACSATRGFETMTITEEDSVPIVAEFVVPGRSSGPIIQYLGTNSNKKITIEFKGVTKKACVTGTPFSLNSALNTIGLGVCDTDIYVNMPNQILNSFTQTEAAAKNLGREMIITNHKKDYSPITGDYTLSKSYIICPNEPPDAPDNNKIIPPIGSPGDNSGGGLGQIMEY